MTRHVQDQASDCAAATSTETLPGDAALAITGHAAVGDKQGDSSGRCRTATEVVRRPRLATGGAAADWPQAEPRPGSAEGIVALLPAMRPRLRRLFERFRIAPHDAEDILQDALIILLRQWTLVDNPAGFLLGTVRLRIAHHLRRRASERLVQLAGDQLEPVGADTPLLRAELRRDASRLLSRLPAPAQRVVLLRFGASLKHREIARVLGQPEARVRQLLSRSLRRLRQDLKDAGAPRARQP